MKEVDLVKIIKDKRKKAGLSQEQLADKIDISLRSYQRVESGESELRFTQLVKVLEILDPNFKQYFIDYFKEDSNYDDQSQTTETKTIDRIGSTVNSLAKPEVISNVKEIEVIKTAMKICPNDNDHLVGYWEWNISKSSFYFSDEVFKIYGLDQDNEMSFDKVMTRVDPIDVPKIKKAIDDLINFNIPYHNVHTVINNIGPNYQVSGVARKFEVEDSFIMFGIAEKLTDQRL